MPTPKTTRGKIRKNLTGDGREDINRHIQRELGLRSPLKNRRK